LDALHQTLFWLLPGVKAYISMRGNNAEANAGADAEFACIAIWI
jgi:hypothetical protein